MRTSLSQQIQSALMFVDNSSRRLMEAQTKAVSGKRISRPSDDVPGANNAMSLRSNINNINQFTNNIIVSKPLMNATLAAVDDMCKTVTSVRDLALAAANPDYSGSSRDAAVQQLNDTLEKMMDIANTKHTDSYIFSGTSSDMSTISNAGGIYTYQGDSGTKRTQILSWVNVPMNIPGDKLFNFDGSAGPGSTDVFTMVTKLRDAIVAGDERTISSQITNIDANYNNLLSQTARLGSWSQRMDSATTTLSDTQDRLKSMLSDTEDVDIASAIVDLKTQENVYQTALSVTQQILSLSLASQKLA